MIRRATFRRCSCCGRLTTVDSLNPAGRCGSDECEAEVWIPPAADCMDHAHDPPCPHCGGRVFHHRTGRCGTCGRRPLSGDEEMATGEAFLEAYRCPELADPPLPSARLIRHRCPTPAAERGLIWRCACGRRWRTRNVFIPIDPQGTWGIHRWCWRRTYWPWPR